MISKPTKVYLSAPHLSGNEMKYVQEALDSNWVAPLGPHVDAFENELAQYVGMKGALAVSSGTAAIHLALHLLGVRRGDRVFCSSLTFVASANPIAYCGAEPVFIDSEPDTWNMSPEALMRALGEALKEGTLPKAVIVVHLYGQSAKMDEIMTICNFYRVPVIEDAAESLGSLYRNQMSGTMGAFGIYSFNGNKIITTSGGGMLVSNDTEALQRARFLSTQAKDPARHYQHSELGYNYRMSNLLAGVGRAQLAVLEDRVYRRREIFRRYQDELGAWSGLQFMPELVGTRSNRWLTTLIIDEKLTGCTPTTLLDALAEQNIEARPIWKPMHLQPLYRYLQYYPHQENVSISDRLFHEGICLPSGSAMTSEEQTRVIETIQDVLLRSKRFGGNKNQRTLSM